MERRGRERHRRETRTSERAGANESNALQKLFAIADRNPVVQHLFMKRLRLVSILSGSRTIRRNLCLLLLVFLVLPASAADRAEEVRAIEIAFAKEFVVRDTTHTFSY